MKLKNLILKLLSLAIVSVVIACGEESTAPDLGDELNGVSSQSEISSIDMGIPDVVSSGVDQSSSTLIISSQMGVSEPTGASTDFLKVDGVDIDVEWSCISNLDRDAASYVGDVFMNMSFDKGWTGTLEAGIVMDPPCTVQLVEDATFGSNFEGATGSCTVTQQGSSYVLEADVNTIHIKNGTFKSIQMSATCEFE